MRQKRFKNSNALKFLSAFILMLSGFDAFSQVPLVNRGERIDILNGSFIYINGSYKSEFRAPGPSETQHRAGYFYGDGGAKIFITDSIINNNIEGVDYGNIDRTYLIDGNPEVVLVRDRPQFVGGITPIHFHKLTIDKSADTLWLLRSFAVTDTLEIVQGNILLNNDSIYLDNETPGALGTLIGENEANRISDRRNGGGAIYTYMENPEGDNIAGMGISIDMNGGQTGRVKISRAHGKIGGPGVSDGGPGDGSILRFYQIELDNKSLAQHIPSVKMTYFNNELDGHDPSSLRMWSSNDTTTLGPASEWTRHDNGALGMNEYTEDDLLIGYTRFTLAPFTCTNPPVITFPADTVFLCEGSDTILNPGLGNMNISWSSDRSFSTVIANTATIETSEAGEYFIRAIDAKGCMSTDSVFVKIVRNPIALMDNLIAGCLLDTSKFENKSTATEPGPLSYLWNFGATGNTTSRAEDTLYVYPSAGTFIASLEVTNIYGCKNMDTDTITISPVPVADFTVDNICLGKNALFTNMSVLSSAVGMQYSWAFGDGATSILLNPEHTYASASTFNVRLIAISNGSQCRDTADKIIQVYASPVAAFTYANDCMLQDIQFANGSTSSTGALTYQWNFGDGTASNQTNPSKIFSQSDFYEVSLIATTPEGCKDTAVVTDPSGANGILIRDCSIDCSSSTPIVNLGPDRHLCDREVVQFDAGNPGASYRWSDGSTTRTINVSSQGIYNVRVRSVEGCLAVDQVEVSVTSGINVNLGSDVVLCSMQGLVLSPVISRTGSFSYTWGSDVGVSGSSQELTVNQAGKYWITVNDLSGCGFFDRDTIEIRPTTNSIKAEFLVASHIKLGDPVEFVQLSDPNPTEYSWSFGDGITSVDRQPVHTYLVEGDFKVFFTVSNGVCTDTLSKRVSVTDPVIRSNGNGKDTLESSKIGFIELPKPLVYPNPTEGAFTYELNLEGEASIEIQIYSLQGTIISIRRVKGKSIREHYDLTEEGSGLYLIRTILNDQMVVNKIIKL